MTARQGSRSRASRGRGPDSIVKNIASTFTAQMTTAALTAMVTVFLVRALGAKQYGLFALTIGMSTVAMAFADLGISNSTARFVAEHRGRDTQLGALIADALKLKVIVTGLTCALLAALASVIAGAYGNPELVWPLRAIAIATFGQSTYLMLLGVSTALGRAIVNVRLVAAESLLEVSAIVALVLAGAGATGAAFGRAIGYVLGAAIAACVVLRLDAGGPIKFWRLPRRATVRRVGGYAGSVFAIDASYTASSSLAVLFLGAYAGAAASGIFQAPAKLIVLVQYVGLSTAYGVAPRLTRGQGQEPNVSALHDAIRGLIAFQCLVLAPAVVWARPITRLLLGPGYSQSADVLSALAPYIFFSGIAPLVTLGVNYLGEARRRVPISLTTLALIAAGCSILIPTHGVVGAAIATDIAFGFYTLAHIWLCRRLFNLRLRMLVWSLACGLTAAGAMGVVLGSVGTKNLTIFDWLKGGAGGIAAYVAMLIFTREVRRADIMRATAAVRTLFLRLKLATRPRRLPGPSALPHPGAPAPTGVADRVGKAAAPTERMSPSTDAAESADVPPAGFPSTIKHVEYPRGVSERAALSGVPASVRSSSPPDTRSLARRRTAAPSPLRGSRETQNVPGRPPERRPTGADGLAMVSTRMVAENNWLAVLWRRKWVVGLVVIAFVVATEAFCATLQRVYSTSATLIVAAPPASFDTTGAAEEAARSYAIILASPNFAALVAKRVGSTQSRIASEVSIQPVAQTQLLTITAEDPSPDRAKLIADDYATAFVQYAPRLSQTNASVSRADPAPLPTAPARPRPLLYGLVAAIIGLAAGVALAFLRERIDDRIRSIDDLRDSTDLPILAEIPERRRSGPTVRAFDQSFLMLRASLAMLTSTPPIRSIAVISSGAGEGKTTVVSELAMSRAAIGVDTLVVDADVHRPGLSSNLMRDALLRRAPGLGDFLTGKTSADNAIYATDVPSVQLMPSGDQVSDLSSILETYQGKAAFAQLTELSDSLIVDCPPIAAGADAPTIAGRVDGVIVVVDLSRATATGLRTTVRQLTAAHATILGIAANRNRDRVLTEYYSDNGEVNGDQRSRRGELIDRARRIVSR